MELNKMRLVVWGAGELGGRVAVAWAQSGSFVVGLTRGSARHDDLRRAGVEPRIGGAVDILTPDDVLLLALPGNANQQAAVDALQHTPPPARAVLISSTGYYGTPAGRVDEDTPCGETPRARSVEAAEQTFRTWAGPSGVVIRCGGLYRPGRGPMSALLRRGTVPEGAPNRTLALIHYVDAARATLAALRHPAPEATYVGVVPPCPTRHEFYTRACAVAGLPEPVFTSFLPHPPAEYDVKRLIRDLLPEPAHPDWRDALVV
jgi:nucleoside-diphosphate-sugar epimerase